MMGARPSRASPPARRPTPATASPDDAAAAAASIVFVRGRWKHGPTLEAARRVGVGAPWELRGGATAAGRRDRAREH